MTVKARFLFSGMVDYWPGNGRRWDSDAGCLFTSYGTGTTMRQLVDGWVDDYVSGGDCDSAGFEDVTEDDIRAAIVAILCAPADREYEESADSPCGLAKDYADANPSCDDDDDGDSPVAIMLVELEIERGQSS